MEESTKQNGNGKTKESADNSLASETDEEERVPTTPVNRKRGKRSSPIAETDEEEIAPTTPVKRKRGKTPLLNPVMKNQYARKVDMSIIPKVLVGKAIPSLIPMMMEIEARTLVPYSHQQTAIYWFESKNDWNR